MLIAVNWVCARLDGPGVAVPVMAEQVWPGREILQQPLAGALP
jgi:hypothetical protein